MLGKSKISFIQSLQKKKFRQKYNLFVVEGVKILLEIIDSSIEIEEIFVLEGYPLPVDIPYKSISESEMKKISSLKTPTPVLALLPIPDAQPLLSKGSSIVLEGIQDPGNLGTIIRLADWFAIDQVIALPGTTDVYNPKTLQASMGSFLRKTPISISREEFISQYTQAIYICDMEGTSIYELPPQKDTFAIVMGNEGNGISDFWKQGNYKTICIPRFSPGAESLNVAMSCGIIISELKSKRFSS